MDFAAFDTVIYSRLSWLRAKNSTRRILSNFGTHLRSLDEKLQISRPQKAVKHADIKFMVTGQSPSVSMMSIGSHYKLTSSFQKILIL